MSWVYTIFSLVWDISDWFYSAYREVSGWVWPFHYLQYPLYGLYRAFWSLLSPIANFAEWTGDVWNKIQSIFSLAQITAYFRTWIDAAINAWNWVSNSFWNVWNIVESWWSSAKFTVLGWIDIATLGFDALIVWWDEFWKITWPQWMATLEVLGSRIDDFFKNTLPGLFNVEYAAIWWVTKLLDVMGLIDSSFVDRKDFWEGWQEMKGKVVEFFQDPLEFLLTLFTDWFLGPEE